MKTRTIVRVITSLTQVEHSILLDIFKGVKTHLTAVSKTSSFTAAEKVKLDFINQYLEQQNDLP